jgi:hypothetical protein
MNPLDSVDVETALSGHGDWLDADLASALAAYPLDCVETEYPHHVGSVEGPDDDVAPARDHPVFYGCFDWHSAVHGHWTLVRLLRLVEDHPDEAAIVGSVSARLTSGNVETETEYLASNPSFERPYGWGWLLRLAAELHRWDDDRGDRWRRTLAPLEEQVHTLVRDEFLSGTRPRRVGTHGNSAFALSCVLDYARVVSDETLETAAVERADAFYGDDEDYPVAYEPLGWDFLSPALVEADLMRRVLDGDAFASWAADFLPDVTTAPHDSILDPVDVAPDPESGVELHLVGLNLSRAWCLADLAAALGDHRYADALAASAERHAERGLSRAFTSDYAGAHWLSSFVVYLLTRHDGGIAPAQSA